MVDGSPTVPARRLGRELKRLREALGKTQVEVGKYVGTPSTTISKIENADRNAPLPHLKLMLQLYEVAPAHAEYLTRLAQQAREPGWWADYGDVVPTWFTEYVGLESAARAVWTYEQESVPGLLQTRAYTEAMTLAVSWTGPSESAEGFARVRATRQERLRGDAPMMLRAVLSEAVLHRQVGGAEVMREQVARLRDAASRPNITVQVLPFSVGAHPGMTGAFTMLRFVERSMDAVFIEQRGGAIYLERPVDVDLHEATFERLSDLALSDDDTISLLNEMERGH
ncbi:MAG: helix-turn-helix transcriptional regulator [Pseudonocardiales bacterium]|nr:helix-turn-helix transcriptional regulator [Pseudonocardiales bacterium]